VGRAVGDRLTIRLGPTLLVRVSGAVAALGLALALAVARPWAAIVGFGAVGAGLSIVFPAVLTAAGRLPGSAAGAAIAAVSMFGYSGFLVGPPVIGLVAEALTLRVGLAIVVATSAVIALLASGLRRAPEGRVVPDSPGSVERAGGYEPAGAQHAA
jgi:MFS family permease